jgi:hypothetical protein
MWSHYLLMDVRKAFRALHPGPGKWPGLSLHYQVMRLCPSIHTFSHERIPSGHSGERATTSRPLVRASGDTCESNHYADLPNRLPCLVPAHGQASPPQGGLPSHYQYRDHALAWPCRIDRPGSPPSPASRQRDLSQALALSRPHDLRRGAPYPHREKPQDRQTMQPPSCSTAEPQSGQAPISATMWV